MMAIMRQSADGTSAATAPGARPSGREVSGNGAESRADTGRVALYRYRAQQAAVVERLNGKPRDVLLVRDIIHLTRPGVRSAGNLDRRWGRAEERSRQSAAHHLRQTQRALDHRRWGAFANLVASHPVTSPSRPGSQLTS
jgi:hypothetical protein